MINDVSKPKPPKAALIQPKSDQEAENRLFLAARGWARKNGSTLKALAYAARLTEGEADAALTRLRSRGRWPYRTPISGVREPRIRAERLKELAADYATARGEYMGTPCIRTRSGLDRAEIRLASALDVQPCSYVDHEGYRYRVILGTLFREHASRNGGKIIHTTEYNHAARMMKHLAMKEKGP